MLPASKCNRKDLSPFTRSGSRLKLWQCKEDDDITDVPKCSACITVGNCKEREDSKNQRWPFRIKSEALSAIITVLDPVCPPGSFGITELSHTRRP